MKSIDNDYINEYIINKSTFIAIISPIHNKNDITNKLNHYKKRYKGATHYCYAYIIDEYSKYSDDGEPSGTAGMPILNILEKNNLNHIICIVIRYFGGIKLGAGGLIRAYSTAVKKVLDVSNIICLMPGYLITIKFDYNNIKSINNLLKDINIKKEFTEKIYYTFNITKDNYSIIQKQLTDLCVITNKDETLVKQ